MKTSAILIRYDKKKDQFRFLGNCPPTPPLSQHYHLFLTWGKMLASGRGRWAVSQKPKLMQKNLLHFT